MIQVNGLSFSYKGSKQLILNDVSLSLNAGEIGILLGRNGSGKSTLFSCLSGVRRSYKGEILIDGKELKTIPAKERAKLVAYVPQISIIQSLSVYDTILLGRLPYYLFGPSKHDHEIAEHVLEELELTPLALKSINEISGGERQKAIIGIALAQQSKLLILDEPTNNLDIKARIDLFEILAKLAKSHQISVLLSTHDISMGYRFGQRFYLFSKEGMIVEGDKSLINSSALSEAYGKPIAIENHGENIVVDYIQGE